MGSILDWQMGPDLILRGGAVFLGIEANLSKSSAAPPAALRDWKIVGGCGYAFIKSQRSKVAYYFAEISKVME
jgi:hypothetical protein